MSNIDALADPETFCVITGQQAGFLGGPAYTFYKIVTAIRLAQHLQDAFGGRCVPVFWLASEDHDFEEINHAHVLRDDGQVGRVGFGWTEAGRPISALAVDRSVLRAYDEYMASVGSLELRKRFAPVEGENYGVWQARLWSNLFSDQGLVVVEPRTVRPLAGGFFQFALAHRSEIQQSLGRVSEQLLSNGYQPALPAERAGQLYTFDANGFRVRANDPEACLDEASAHPERFSADAALRPLLADTVLPVAASVLGPGEIAYQAMLKPVYELFELPQPLAFPRKSYTVQSQAQADTLARYRLDGASIVRGQADVDAVFAGLVPREDRERFTSVRHDVERALAPLRSHVQGIDPGLERTWQQTLGQALRALGKLEDRAIRAQMSQGGLSKQELLALQNALLPKGRLQERVFPLPHFLDRFGWEFVEAIFGAGNLGDFGHHVVTLADGHA
jgi:bacillithiol biosynthesis cysteine-adding enzyme BshC